MSEETDSQKPDGGPTPAPSSSLPCAEFFGDIVAVCDKCGAKYVSMAEGLDAFQCMKCSYGKVRRVKQNYRGNTDPARAFDAKPEDMADDYLVTLALQLHARACGQCNRSLHERSVEITKELQRRVADLRKHKDRIDWLHSGGGDTDPEGYEWGVARVKFNENGRVVSALWTASDHSDLDAEMARAGNGAG